jgi:hypothetical protein
MNESGTRARVTIGLRLSRRRIMPWLWAVTGTLVALTLSVNALRHITGRETIFGLVPLFDVDSERGVPTFFSACLLMGAASLLWLIAKVKRVRQDPFRSHWTVLAAGFFFLAMDEVAGFHEQMVRPVNLVFGTVHGLWHHTWPIAGAAAVLVVVLCYRRFLFHLPVHYQTRFLLAGMVYIGGAIGFEMLGGRHHEIHGNDFVHAIYMAIEEGMEMSGIVLFIGALLPYSAAMQAEVRITVSDPATASSSVRVPAGSFSLSPPTAKAASVLSPESPAAE